MNKLDEIFAYKKTKYETYLRKAEKLNPQILTNQESLVFTNTQIQIIGEIKRASPSAAVIDDCVDLLERTRFYEMAGVSMISVLTESHYFKGSYTDLKKIRSFTTLPLLNKDFIYCEAQIKLARHFGASHILLIATCLDQKTLFELYDYAKAYGMDVLLEIHDREDYEKIKGTEIKLVGINNRNLKTMEVSIQNTLSLLPYMDSQHHIVSESGIKTPQDIKTLYQNGVTSFLIGESLMREKQPEALIRSFLEVAYET
jgi:indole-3-glycerol phosphate synthase